MRREQPTESGGTGSKRTWISEGLRRRQIYTATQRRDTVVEMQSKTRETDLTSWQFVKCCGELAGLDVPKTVVFQRRHMEFETLKKDACNKEWE
jgi:hypothetical protein